MRRYAAPVVLAGVFAFLLSCNPLLGPLPSGMVSAAMVQQVPYSGTFQYTVDPGSTPRDVYFVFTNPSLTQNAASVPTVSGSISVDGKGIPAPASQPLSSTNSAPQSLTDRIAEFNRNPRAYLPASAFPGPSAAVVSSLPAQNDVADYVHATFTTGTFYTNLNADGTGAGPVSATCRDVVGPVSFADGRSRTLSVWVDDTYWNVDANQTTTATFASKFLAGPAESSADIYHWDTSVVGEPWGPQNDPSLITWDPHNTVTILLTRLNGSYAPGSPVIVGYYWAKDNFSTSALPGSNQRIMFYIDSYLYNTNPTLVYSTLAHEFQHMIQFYQKQVVLGATVGTDTWINEMGSMIMEDLVADKLNVDGPRGVLTGDAGGANNNAGRFPLFNKYSNLSLAVTGSNFGVVQYSVAYAFGSWLTRNYGGPALLTRIVQCPQTDYTAVANAAAAFSGRTETMEGLLQKWAASVLISDDTSAPPGYRYNTGTWTSFSLGSETFNLGSINVFNYSPALTVYSSSVPIPAAPYYSSNIYFKAASMLAGPRTFSVTIPSGTGMSVVLK